MEAGEDLSLNLRLLSALSMCELSVVVLYCFAFAC